MPRWAASVILQQEQKMNPKPHLDELTPTEVHDALRRHAIVLVDVREPQEYVTCIEAGVAVIQHMKGGIIAWKHACYPTITLDPNTGAVVDRQ
jgi:rhodanese-related sulfurtransferase